MSISFNCTVSTEGDCTMRIRFVPLRRSKNFYRDVTDERGHIGPFRPGVEVAISPKSKRQSHILSSRSPHE
ncbi:uncharacterized protein PHALS_13588 [Plasmopara halstedii]|uniref:Uncharacterized protein n=1 Tax=Plasmopara halstedii TaxID=4781 RepID=A0A0P1AQK3_PLAHL|nr:uncharacterized protein PHALS_13588 [Plasmopara halstedii]CEG43391.1 hypothetical protein PHALS_13588 [Plasmopara halstedii]|eukprot:XP_024579760.1 hypothetical protein PHALS_13588 [Plasmopara halstedii]